MNFAKFILRLALGLFIGKLAMIFFRRILVPLLGAAALWFGLHQHFSF